jgi:PAS domain S-box-containing protein
LTGFDLQTLYVWHAFAAAVIAASLALYLAPRWGEASARALLQLMAAVAVWCFTYGMEFSSTELESKLWWVRMEYLGAAWTGLFFFRFAMAVTGRKAWLDGPRGWGLYLVPALTIVAVFTNAHHQLIWSHAWINTEGPVPALAYHRGTGFWIFVAYSYGLLLAGTLDLLYRHLFSGEIESRHLWVMLIGLLLPWASNLIYLLEIEPVRHIDLTPAAFAVSGLAFFWGAIRHQMLDLIPIARDAVIKSMTDAVFVLDLRDRIIDLNTAARQLLPGQDEKSVGQPLAVLYPDLYIRVEQSRHNAYEEVEMSSSKAGRTTLWRLRQSPLYSRSKAIGGWLVILQDITGLKQNELALRESEEKFRSISANALDAIVMIDPHGRISFWNRAAEALFGYRAQEILGKDLHEQLAPASPPPGYREMFDTFQNTGDAPLMGRTIEINCLRKNGEIFPAELSLSPLQLNDEWHAVGIIRDTTERKKTQEYLIQNEKMLSLGGLAAGMAHEINNPLAGILANVQVMRMRLLSDMPDNITAAEACGVDLKKVWAYMGQRGIINKIEAIDQSCQRAAGIVRNMLSFSRKSDAVFSENDLAELIDQTVDLAMNDFQLAANHDFRQIRIQRRYLPEMPLIPCDSGQIQQVVFNILKNGAQAMWEQDGEHRPPEFRLTVDRRDDWARIIIADNGPGIAEEIRTRIFEPFYTTKPTGSGTGLGLSIAYFIITENHAGRLTVTSSPGSGTTFTIKLPLKPQP